MSAEKIKAFFKLVRWFHEVVVVLPFLTLYIIINYYSVKNNIDCRTSGLDFALICFCVQLLIAAGCVMNDIADRKIDKINKPVSHTIDNTISLRSAWRIFIVLSLFIMAVSAYISLRVFSEWAFISIGVYGLSFLYNFKLKRSPLAGNILMAALTAFIPLVLFFFAEDCIRGLNNEKINTLICLYAALPFLVIIPRELSLDISDIEGDRAGACYTLPIAIGVAKSRIVVIAFLALIILLSIPAAFRFPYLAAPLVCVDLLLLIYISKFRNARTRLDYIRIGRFLWAIMIFGLVAFSIATIF